MDTKKINAMIFRFLEQSSNAHQRQNGGNDSSAGNGGNNGARKAISGSLGGESLAVTGQTVADRIFLASGAAIVARLLVGDGDGLSGGAVAVILASEHVAESLSGASA
jgi:hypothetical protein